MKRCKFKQGKFNCGSYAFNLYKEGIDQGDFCDHHYWQDQAMKARADEREACAKMCDVLASKTTLSSGLTVFDAADCAGAIRARSNT